MIGRKTSRATAHRGGARLANAAASAVAALILAATAATEAAAQSEGPVMASAAALGIRHTEAVELERQWDALNDGTRRRILCAGTRGRCRDWIEGLRVYRTIPAVFRSYGPSSVARYLRNKDWSHIVPWSQDGDDTAANGRWEVRRLNRLRGARVMTPREIAAAERLARSSAFKERLRALARRASRGTAVGAVIVAATVITGRALDYRSGRISEEEFLTRLADEVGRDMLVGALVGAVFGAVTVNYPVLAPVLGPVVVFIGAELWSQYGVSISNDTAETAERWWSRLPFTDAARRTFSEPPIFGWTLAAPTAALPSYRPEVRKTATARTLYAPPIADPNELLEYIAAELGHRGVHGPVPRSLDR